MERQVTMEELIALMNKSWDEFIIHVDFGMEEGQMPRKKNDFKLDVISVRLVKDAHIFSDCKIASPEDAVDVIGNQLCEMDREVVCVINLKTDGTPINCYFASMGTLNEAIVHPRELLKASILSNAVNIILVHSHLSGSLKPSKEDIKIADRMIDVCGFMVNPLLDHIIVGGDNRVMLQGMIKSMELISQMGKVRHWLFLRLPLI